MSAVCMTCMFSHLLTSGNLSLGNCAATQDTYFLWPAKVSRSSQTGGLVELSWCHNLTVQSLEPEMMQLPPPDDAGSGMEARQRTSLEWPESTAEKWKLMLRW